MAWGPADQFPGLCRTVQFRRDRTAKEGGESVRGERNRVHLARMLKQGANVLLLDEPTNDLDVNILRAMEEALENFGGCKEKDQKTEISDRIETETGAENVGMIGHTAIFYRRQEDPGRRKITLPE